MCANVRDPRSHDRNWDTQKTLKKTAIFGLKIYQFAFNSKTTWRAKLEFEHNVVAYECYM